MNSKEKAIEDLRAQIADAKARGDLYQKEMCERFLAKYVDVPDDIEAKISAIKEKITGAVNPEEIVYSFLPHEMCKVPIFYPLSDKELSEDRRVFKKVTAISKWGEATIRGFKLSIFEEDVLLALIKLAKGNLNPTDKELILETTLVKVAKFIYGKNGHGRENYISIDKAIKNLGLVQFSISIFGNSKNGFSKTVEHEITISALIYDAYVNLKTGLCVVKFNPGFFTLLSNSSLTYINFTLRRKLKKAGSKALLRFISTHKGLVRINILTALKAINFNTNQPMFRLRCYVKECFAELKKAGVLGSKAKIYPDDTLYFDVNTSVLKPRKPPQK